MSPADFIHPEDEAALSQMQNLPGFTAFIKKFMALGYETQQYGINMASAIRLSEHQLPELYHRLPPICEKLGIPEPEFYLEMNPYPNALTSGDTKVFIKINSSIVEMMNEEELDAIIAHECGHILCHHVLYGMVAQWLKTGLDALGILGRLSDPIKYALFYWYRKSELSADRAAAIITSPETVARTMARLAGGPKSLTSTIDFEEWAKQADEYESIRNSNLWNKTLQIHAVLLENHPFTAVRVREILKWGKSEQYQTIKKSLDAQNIALLGSGHDCPSCGKPLGEDWAFCRHCGQKL